MEEKTKTLTKVIYKNQIVSMRHNVRRARVQTIHKLSRTVKILRGKGGKEEEKEQNSKKAERLSGEILTLKRLKDDDIAEFCLKNTRNAQEILADKNEGMEIKAMARLSLHSSISSVVVNFRFRYPNWASALIKIENEGKKRRRKLKPCLLNRDKISEQKITLENNSKPCETDDYSDASGESNSTEDSEVSASDREETVLAELDIDEKETDMNLMLGETYKKTKSKVAQLKTPVNNNTSEKKMKLSIENNEIPETLNISSDIKFADVSKNLKKVNRYIFDDSEAIPEDSTKYVDPFFVTNDNKAYLSYAAVGNNDDTSETDKHIDQHVNRQESNLNKTTAFFEKGIRRKFAHINKGGVSRRNNFSEVRQKESFQKGSPTDDIKLHPSWEAKRKQRVSIQGFQGKKIVFDE